MSSISKGKVVAIVGATGAVGQTLLNVLEERRFPVRALIPLASGRSVGLFVTFAGSKIPVREATPEAFSGIDIVFFAATGELSKTLAPAAVQHGAIVIDKSSTWRMQPDVPLVVPEVNAAAMNAHRGIIACPNCTTIGLVMLLEPLRRAAGLCSAVVTTLQAVSGAGQAGLDELHNQLRSAASGMPLRTSAFMVPIANNVIPVCETFRPDGYTTEEYKLLAETRKIMGLPDLMVSMTCVRVPVPVGHAATVLVETETPLSPQEARHALAEFPGVRVVDSVECNQFPTPRDVAGLDTVLVGRIRKDFNSDRLWFWEVSDNIRKGAATNAVQIAERLL